MREIKIIIKLTIIPILVGFYSLKQPLNSNFKISDIHLDTSNYINFNLTNKLKSSIKVFTIKKEGTDCRILKNNFKKHKPINKSWGTAIPWYGPGNYDSLIIAPGKSYCFNLNVDTKGVDTVLAVSSYNYKKNNYIKEESLYFCFVINEGKVSEFNPNFEIKQILYSMTAK